MLPLAELVVALTLANSAHLGERPMSLGAAAYLESGSVYAALRWDSSDKIESSAGWIGSGRLEVGRRFFAAGAYKYRDGGQWGQWVKRSVWIGGGARLKVPRDRDPGRRFTARILALADLSTSNEVKSVELRMSSVKRRAASLDFTYKVLRYVDSVDVARYGLAAELGLGWGLR